MLAVREVQPYRSHVDVDGRGLMVAINLLAALPLWPVCTYACSVSISCHWLSERLAATGAASGVTV